MEYIIDKILKADEYAFFVGDNANEIIGLLGEMKAYFYLSKIIDYKKQSAILHCRLLFLSCYVKILTIYLLSFLVL